MEDIHNKEQRKALMERFLRAETSPEEEQSLRNFFLQFQGTLSEEEEEFRTLLLAVTSSPRFAPLSEEKVQEFDRLTHLRSWRVMFRRTVLSLSAAAALLTAVWWLLPRTEEIATPVSLVSVPSASFVSSSARSRQRGTNSHVLLLGHHGSLLLRADLPQVLLWLDRVPPVHELKP